MCLETSLVDKAKNELGLNGVYTLSISRRHQLLDLINERELSKQTILLCEQHLHSRYKLLSITVATTQHQHYFNKQKSKTNDEL